MTVFESLIHRRCDDVRETLDALTARARFLIPELQPEVARGEWLFHRLLFPSVSLSLSLFPLGGE